MFLLVVDHNVRFKALQPIFRRSTETVSKYFGEVLYAVGELRNDLVKPPSSDIPRTILGNRRFNPYYKADAEAVADRSGAGVEVHGGRSGVATTRSGAPTAGSGRGGAGTASARRGRRRPRQAVAGAPAAQKARAVGRQRQAWTAALGGGRRDGGAGAGGRGRLGGAAAVAGGSMPGGDGSGAPRSVPLGWIWRVGAVGDDSDGVATAAAAVGDGDLGRIWTPAVVGDDGGGVVAAVAAVAAAVGR
ncbi:hypothetical protein OsI_30436 [Oryza sativa Indica Group]|uniref:DUF8040 domain-containing protein n=1 Tax=Oryza sativa subsp. indica TaxID=39946 RepID=A2YYL4_ORYSI|nr:hypothetical protein OsI_30436 [Oryza sativa Indica Group]